MFLFIATVISHLSACDVANNDPDIEINPDCNYAGKCVNVNLPNGRTRSICVCCAPEELSPTNWCVDHWRCDPENPSFQCLQFKGSSCTDVDQYFFVSFGFRVDVRDEDESADVICHTDPEARAKNGTYSIASAYFHLQVNYITRGLGWLGIIDPSPLCDTCSPAYPCTTGTDSSLNVTRGYNFGFQAQINEHYSSTCEIGLVFSVAQVPECDANYDYGQSAYKVWQSVVGDVNSGDTSFIDAVQNLVSAEPDDSNGNYGLGWSNTAMLAMNEEATKVTRNDVYITISPTLKPTSSPTIMPTPFPTVVPTSSPTIVPTLSPTIRPTEVPTLSPSGLPTQTPTLECGPYTNSVEDLEFQGVGTDCRAGLNSSWPGGLTCDSPYIVCLPQENTPAAFGGQPYKDVTHRYSVDECLQECANDQRCLGVEFVADSASAFGDCNLIDDIPPEITSMVSGFNYDPSVTYENLDSSITDGNALCFEKKDDCYPYFEPGDLNDVMLNCYCPNNRKGFYTKKVKRTVGNTRFCGSDGDVEVRIQKAQANRMFHLCENWCLFNTDDPEAESWYWDPWKTCWREQYDDIGAHTSYCNRVITSPDTIEMQFINHRKNLFCRELLY